MRRVLPLKIALATMLIAACVTINVYFPAAAADKAADQVIKDITGASATPPTGYFVPARGDEPNFLVAALGATLDAIVPAAQAQGAEALNVSSPAITRITASMGQRFGELRKFFESGAIGLTKDGNAWSPKTTPTVRSFMRRSRRPTIIPSGKPTFARASPSAGWRPARRPAGTTRTTAAPGSRSS
jgi:hypothetical protein